jgi:hypothetical protein
LAAPPLSENLDVKIPLSFRAVENNARKKTARKIYLSSGKVLARSGEPQTTREPENFRLSEEAPVLAQYQDQQGLETPD